MQNYNINDYIYVNLEKFDKTIIHNNSIPDLRNLTKNDEMLTVKFPMSVETPNPNYYKKFYLGNVNLDEDIKNKLKITKEKNNETKLFSKKVFGVEMTYLLDKEIKKRNDVSIIDIGCGNGENEDIFYKLGAAKVILTDFYSAKAHILTDVHNLPFKDESFDIVFTSQAIEHFYNPFIAFKEISRILKKDGTLVASTSFMERWHGNSFFHCSPHAIHALCEINSLELINLWHSKSGWMDLFNSDFILKKIKIKYFANILNYISDSIYLLFKNKKSNYSKKLYTSQSFGFLAKKNVHLKKNKNLDLNNLYSRTNIS